MSQWTAISYMKIDSDINKVVRSSGDDDIEIRRYNGYNQLYNQEDPYFKTIGIICGCYEPGIINLFDLQKWFDDNREWINSLKKECK